MKIPSKFPQFEDKRVLIVATGAQDADIYIMVKSVFPAALRSKIKISIAGNFSQHSPQELIKKIERQKEY